VRALTRDVHNRSTQELYNLVGLEWPVEFSPGIATPQYGDAQGIALKPVFAFDNIDQFNQQTMLDKRHQHRLSHITHMTAKGTEKLAFREHPQASVG